MELDTARWLVSPEAAAALAAADAQAEPGSLGAATALRALVAPDRAAAALTQASLRRRGRVKFGDRAATMFFTPDGLEQATRAAVAARRAAWFAAAGVPSVIDLGCGLGADASALQHAGVGVQAVERDPVTAVLAQANLGVEVCVGDAQEAWPRLAAEHPEAGVFVDPARRTGAGRTWRIEDLSPPWEFAVAVLTCGRPAALKLGPGVPRRVIPRDVEAAWVSDARTVVECSLFAGPTAVPGRRTAIVDGVLLHGDGAVAADVGPIGAYLYEPDGAVVRAGLVDDLAARIGARRLDPQAAYLTAEACVPTPFADLFAVTEVLPFDERVLRGWVREHRIGILEIKKRGLEVDPAVLRKRLKPSGRAAATLVLTPTPDGARVVVCTRMTDFRRPPLG